MKSFFQGLAMVMLLSSSMIGLGFAGGIERGARIAENAPALLICLAFFALSVYIINKTEEENPQ